jgi:hypothetical protein
MRESYEYYDGRIITTLKILNDRIDIHERDYAKASRKLRKHLGIKHKNPDLIRMYRERPKKLKYSHSLIARLLRKTIVDIESGLND